MKMKKILTCIALCIAIAAHSNPLPDNIYQAIVTKFTASFPKADDVKWHSGQDEYVVSFKKNEMRYKIYYDLRGNLTSTIS